MISSYTVREWGRLDYGSAKGRIPEHLADRLASIAAASPFAGIGGSGVLEHGRHALKARGIVGVLACDAGALEILPKIEASDRKAPDDGGVRKHLVNMLSVALDLKIDVGAVTELEWQRNTLLEILIRVFADKLTEAVRRSMPRRYLQREDDLAALRGTLNTTRQFTRFAANPSKLACRFDELSEDIVLNRIMKAAVSHLLRLSRSPSNQRQLRELSFIYADISAIPPPALRWNEVVMDRTNHRWQELLGMARLFLQNAFQTSHTGSGQGSALLFEMSALFEEYVARQIKRAVIGSDLTVSTQGGRLFCLTAEDTGRRLFQTKPDILIRRGGVVVHVIDTKWKLIASRIDDPKQGVSQADVYQMMAYGQLYGAPRLTLLYPHHSGLGSNASIQARHRITVNEAMLEMATFAVNPGRRPNDHLQYLLEVPDLPLVAHSA